MASTDAIPVPKKNTAFRVIFPIFDADGDLVTGATGLDSEVSKDQGTFADCTNEATEIATASGMYYLDLTSTEMNADCVAVIVKTTSSGAKTTPIVLYPQEAGDIPVDVQSISGDSTAADNAEAFFDGTGYAGTNNVIPTVSSVATGGITSSSFAAGAINAAALAADAITDAKVASDVTIASVTGAVGSVTADSVHTGTAQAGGASSITLAAGASATNNIYNYQRIDITSGTGAGQSAIIIDYVGSTKVATVDYAWNVTPDNTSVYRVAYSRVPRSVSKVTGDVEGKILGTTAGGGTMSGAGVWAYDHTGAAISGGGSSDWTTDEKTAIKTILGVPASGTTPDAPSAGALKVIDDFLDTEVAAIKAKTDLIPAAPAEVGSAMTLADGAITTAKFASGAIDAAAIATDAFGALELAAGAASEIAAAVVDQAVSGHTTSGTFGEAINNASANSTTILSRIGSFTGSGVNTILGFFKALMSKTASTPSDVGGTFSAATDSTEAIRDRGDAAWTSGAGYEVRAAINPDDAGNVLVSAFLTLNGVKVALASGSCEVICRETTAGVDAWTATSSTVVDGFYFNVSHSLAAPANGENYLFKITVTDAAAVEYETVIPLTAV